MPNPIAIITLHHIHPRPGRLTVPPELLEKALIQIQQRYRFISYDRFSQLLTHGGDIPKGQVLVTLDDGYLDNYLFAYPVFQRLSIPCVIFAVTGLIQEQSKCRSGMEAIEHKTIWRTPDPKYFINTAEWRELSNSGLVSLASHSHSHMICSGKTEMELDREFSLSFDFIRGMNGDSAPRGFCWPGGSYDDLALAAIKKSSYEFAFSTMDGGWYYGDPPFTIRRIDCSSYSGDEGDYLGRLKRKLWIYSSTMIGRWYRGFKNSRMKLLNR